MSRNFNHEDIVGSYENIKINRCLYCEKDIIEIRPRVGIEPVKITDATFLGFNKKRQPWTCPLCNITESTLSKGPYCSPNKNMGIRFECCECQKENIQILEPSKIIHPSLEEQKAFHLPNCMVVYVTPTVTCMFCLSEFERAIAGDTVVTLDGSTSYQCENHLFMLKKRV